MHRMYACIGCMHAYRTPTPTNGCCTMEVNGSHALLSRLDCTAAPANLATLLPERSAALLHNCTFRNALRPWRRSSEQSRTSKSGWHDELMHACPSSKPTASQTRNASALHWYAATIVYLLRGATPTTMPIPTMDLPQLIGSQLLPKLPDHPTYVLRIDVTLALRVEDLPRVQIRSGCASAWQHSRAMRWVAKRLDNAAAQSQTKPSRQSFVSTTPQPSTWKASASNSLSSRLVSAGLEALASATCAIAMTNHSPAVR